MSSEPETSGTEKPVPQQTQNIRVLSIQSHVVRGFVGNRCAVFALQLLGIDVDVINSCMLSNHTGYLGGFKGPKTTYSEIAAILSGLDGNQLLGDVTHLLTGYCANEDALNGVVRALGMIREAGGRETNPQTCTYVCDPVLGDNGKLYVPKELVSVYRERILPLANVLTPNCYELSLLAEVEYPQNEQDVLSGCAKLHDTYKVPLIVVTGASFSRTPTKISVIVSDIGGAQFALDANRLDSQFTGSGDLTSALTLAWLELSPGDIRSAMQRAMASVSATLETTLADRDRGVSTSQRCPLPELRLVQSLKHILSPPIDMVTVRELVASQKT